MLLLSRPAGAGTAEYANIHTIGVISTLGVDIDYLHLDGTLHVETHDIEHPSWGIDDAVFGMMKSALGNRFALTRVVVDAAQFNAAGNSNSALRDRVLALPNRESFDAFIAVIPNETAAAINLRGLGLLRGEPFWGIGKAVVLAHAVFEVVVFDAKTGEVIDHGNALMGNGPFGGGYPTAGCKEDLWPKAERTPAAEDNVKSVLLYLVATGIPLALGRAELADKSFSFDAPEIGDRSWAAFCELMK